MWIIEISGGSLHSTSNSWIKGEEEQEDIYIQYTDIIKLYFIVFAIIFFILSLAFSILYILYSEYCCCHWFKRKKKKLKNSHIQGYHIQ